MSLFTVVVAVKPEGMAEPAPTYEENLYVGPQEWIPGGRLAIRSVPDKGGRRRLRCDEVGDNGSGVESKRLKEKEVLVGMTSGAVGGYAGSYSAR